MHRSIAAVALASLFASTPACTMSRSSSRTTMVAGAGMALGGVLLTKSSVVDADQNGVNEDPFDDDLGTALLGTMLILGGLAMFGVGVTAQEPEAPTAPPVVLAEAPAPPSGSIAAAVQPGTLPEAPVTADVLRLAQQVRSAVLRNECEAAWRTLELIDERDAGYASLMASSSVMRGCERVY